MKVGYSITRGKRKNRKYFAGSKLPEPWSENAIDDATVYIKKEHAKTALAHIREIQEKEHGTKFRNLKIRAWRIK